jgi:hypothetical protein
MSTFGELLKEVESLKQENARLKRNIQELTAKHEFIVMHPTLASGMIGERIVAHLTNGKLTAYAAGHDVEAKLGEIRIEVKYANARMKQAGRPDKRWAWGKILGEGGKKVFDYLLLIGEKDPQFESAYLDPESPFVFFLVPSRDISDVIVNMGSRYKGIYLTTNPTAKLGTRSLALYRRFQTTSAKLQSQFGI